MTNYFFLSSQNVADLEKVVCASEKTHKLSCKWVSFPSVTQSYLDVPSHTQVKPSPHRPTALYGRITVKSGNSFYASRGLLVCFTRGCKKEARPRHVRGLACGDRVGPTHRCIYLSKLVPGVAGSMSPSGHCPVPISNHNDIDVSDGIQCHQSRYYMHKR